MQEIFGLLFFGVAGFFGFKAFKKPDTSAVVTVDEIGTQEIDLNLSFLEITKNPFSASAKDEAREKADALLRAREGVRYIVYKDSLGYPTGGIGHLIKVGENYSVGDRIPVSVVNKWFAEDLEVSLNAGYAQAQEIGQGGNVEMITALTSVNFQLGLGWRSKFPNTWAKIKAGDYNGAINNIKVSLWAKQTPKRTNDFIKALEGVA